jgi:hypothetical protein
MCLEDRPVLEPNAVGIDVGAREMFVAVPPGVGRESRAGVCHLHREVFGWVLGVLADRGLLKGQRIAIDATTLEAKAALRSMVRRDAGENYEEFLRKLAKASGIATPTREDLARLDRKRKKRTSNKEWTSPADGDARCLSRRTVTTGSKNPVSQIKSC